MVRALSLVGERPMRREDYERLIDSEIWAFIRRADEWFPPETIGRPIERHGGAGGKRGRRTLDADRFGLSGLSC